MAENKDILDELSTYICPYPSCCRDDAGEQKEYTLFGRKRGEGADGRYLQVFSDEDRVQHKKCNERHLELEGGKGQKVFAIRGEHRHSRKHDRDESDPSECVEYLHSFVREGL